jgi:hypothetical protein
MKSQPKKKKTKNNNSIYYKDWTTAYLKQQARETYDIIYGQNACYGSHDLQKLQGIYDELENRGIQQHYKLYFN